jgi:hypothetical protein
MVKKTSADPMGITISASSFYHRIIAFGYLKKVKVFSFTEAAKKKAQRAPDNRPASSNLFILLNSESYKIKSLP